MELEKHNLRVSAVDDLKNRKHFISLERSDELIANFNRHRKALINDNLKEIDEQVGILPICESFNANVIRKALSQPGCEGLRIYMGLNDHYEVVFVLRGIDGNGIDIKGPAETANKSLSSDVQPMSFAMKIEQGYSFDDAQRVPPWPDPTSNA